MQCYIPKEWRNISVLKHREIKVESRLAFACKLQEYEQVYFNREWLNCGLVMMHLILCNKQDGFTSNTEVICHRGKTASLAGKAGGPKAVEVPARALTSRRRKPVLCGRTRGGRAAPCSCTPSGRSDRCPWRARGRRPNTRGSFSKTL